MVVNLSNPIDSDLNEMQKINDNTPAWKKNHNPKNDIILNRDSQKLEILNMIDIDLPSIEDIKALRMAREQEIRKTNADEENYSFNKSTDFAALTGRQSFDDIYYLSTTYEDKVSYYKNGDFRNEDDTIRYSRKNIIRPVLKFSRCPELFDAILSSCGINKNGDERYARILLGWMPRYAESKSNQEKINQALKEKVLSKTNDVYTIDGTYIPNEKNTKKHFKPLECPVYEIWDGTRFIHFKVFQNHGNSDILERLILYKTDAITLKNSQTYFNGDRVWLLVSKIPWIVDIERKVLIAQEGLLCGIQFDNYVVKNYEVNKMWENDNEVDYQASNIKWFLETYMKYEMLTNEPLLFHKAKTITPDKPTNDNKTSEITEILNKIKTYKKFYYGDVDIDSKVHDLINEYNKRLDEIAGNIGHKTNSLSIEVNNPNLLYQKLILNLNDILKELIIHGEKVKNYYGMIEILEECQKEKIDTSKDEICMTINTIKTVILKFITNEKIKNKLEEELNRIIIDNINRNKAYIEEFKNNDNAKSRSLDELKLEFKKDIQPYLIILNDVANKQDLVNEIMNDVQIMITNHFTESKNKIVKNYLDILNGIITRIKEKGTDDDFDKLKNSVKLDYDINEDVDDIVRKLEAMINDAYKIELNIQERNNSIREINSLKVNYDFEETKTK